MLADFHVKIRISLKKKEEKKKKNNYLFKGKINNIRKRKEK